MSSEWKLRAITVLTGAVLGGVISLLFPVRYVSSAVLVVAEQQRFRAVEQDVLSRASLAETIQRPSLDLYRRERTRLPLEDVIQSMRTQDIRIEPLLKSDSPGVRFRISFEYPDRE